MKAKVAEYGRAGPRKHGKAKRTLVLDGHDWYRRGMDADALSQTHPIILFDAQCVLCSANAQFILRKDRRHHFKLAAMQGEVGAALLRRFGMDPSNPDTLIVVEGHRVRRDSDAVLAIYSALGWPWRVLGAFRAVPPFIRDPLYRLVARNRYRLFGRRDVCWMPSAEQAERVL